MQTKFLMGNQAIAYAAYAAGVNIACGYPGTPSTEIIETFAKIRDDESYVEWSINEKAAMEVAAGASMAGARTIVTMKQVGLNVASDPLMSLSYLGVKGGMVIIVADDPGPISSQTEQDTRTFAEFSKVPLFDPSTPEEAYDMVFEAFELSEKYHTPVFIRPTTRVCHGYAQIALRQKTHHAISGFTKSPQWVIFPKLSYEAHKAIEERNNVLSSEFSHDHLNTIEGTGKFGIATSGISYAYVKEALKDLNINARILKISTPFPFPEEKTREFFDEVHEVLVFEELDPYIERHLLQVAATHNCEVNILGKLTGNVQRAGELSQESIHHTLTDFFGLGNINERVTPESAVALPVRPPALCAGCPHRGSFYIVKRATKGKKAVYSGDIGCYTLGNSAPLDMVDTCLCMGAGITMAQGLHRAEPDAYNIAFIGDSTFFASGITGVINAVYNQTDITIILVDNSTTAMTGGQPHPGTAQTMMNTTSARFNMEELLGALKVSFVTTANPFDIDGSTAIVEQALRVKGVSVVIFKAPCIQLFKSVSTVVVDAEACTGCLRCVTQLGCPALSLDGDKVKIDQGLCNGCGLCQQICTFDALKSKELM